MKQSPGRHELFRLAKHDPYAFTKIIRSGEYNDGAICVALDIAAGFGALYMEQILWALSYGNPSVRQDAVRALVAATTAAVASMTSDPHEAVRHAAEEELERIDQ